MSKKLNVGISFYVEVEVPDEVSIEDINEIARLTRPVLIDRITSDSIGDNIEEIDDPEDGILFTEKEDL